MDTTPNDETVAPDIDHEELTPTFLEQSLNQPRWPSTWSDIGPDGVCQTPSAEY